MGLIDKMAAARARLTPKKGCALVCLDDFEPLGEDLKLIGNFATEEEAIAEQRRRETATPGNTYLIFKAGQ